MSTEFEVELVATVLVGVLLLVSAGIAVFILYKFRKSQDSQAGGETLGGQEVSFYFLFAGGGESQALS